MTNSSCVISSPQATHIWLLPARPETPGMLRCGKRPSASLFRMRRRRGAGLYGDLPVVRRYGQARLTRVLARSARQPERPGCRLSNNITGDGRGRASGRRSPNVIGVDLRPAGFRSCGAPLPLVAACYSGYARPARPPPPRCPRPLPRATQRARAAPAAPLAGLLARRRRRRNGGRIGKASGSGKFLSRAMSETRELLLLATKMDRPWTLWPRAPRRRTRSSPD